MATLKSELQKFFEKAPEPQKPGAILLHQTSEYKQASATGRNFYFKAMRFSSSRFSAGLGAIAICSLTSCGNINNSWEVKGGGYFKYQINDGESHTIELDDEDVEIPYIRNSHHYFIVHTRAEASKSGDVFSIMVNHPVLGENQAVQGYTWMQTENAPKANLTGKNNIIHFDYKNDSTWTADIDLQFVDCKTGECNNNLPPLHVTGRLRYWIPEEYR